MEAIANKPVAEQIKILKDIHEHLTVTAKIRKYRLTDTQSNTAAGSSSNATKTELDKAVTGSFNSASQWHVKQGEIDRVLIRINKLKAMQAREKELDQLGEQCKKLTELAAQTKRHIGKHFDATNKAEEEAYDVDSWLADISAKRTTKRKFDDMLGKAEEFTALCKKLKGEDDEEMGSG